MWWIWRLGKIIFVWRDFSLSAVVLVGAVSIFFVFSTFVIDWQENSRIHLFNLALVMFFGGKIVGEIFIIIKENGIYFPFRYGLMWNDIISYYVSIDGKTIEINFTKRFLFFKAEMKIKKTAPVSIIQEIDFLLAQHNVVKGLRF
jgi:hypothetical protein